MVDAVWHPTTAPLNLARLRHDSLGMGIPVSGQDVSLRAEQCCTVADCVRLEDARGTGREAAEIAVEIAMNNAKAKAPLKAAWNGPPGGIFPMNIMFLAPFASGPTTCVVTDAGWITVESLPRRD
jgi:hypothetical protein